MPDDDVASSLNDLERKLQALERELHAGRGTGGAGLHAHSTAVAAGRDGDDPRTAQSPFAAALAAPELPASPSSAEPPAAHSYVATPPVPPRAPAEAGAEPPSANGAAHLVGDARAELSGLQAHLDELMRFREQFERSAQELLAEYDRLLAGLRAAAEREQAAAGATAALEATVLDGMLTIDAGPFEEMAALARFEQALREVPGARDVHVRTLERSRALVDVILGEPVAFGAALRRASTQPLAITRAAPGHVTVELA